MRKHTSLTKKEHIEYWKATSEKDWKATQDLFRTKHYIHALFWSHLVLEKFCKAHWVKDNIGNHPPRIHNLVRLIEQTHLKFSDEEMDFLRRMNDFQLEGRYPDYQNTLYHFYKSAETKKILKRVNLIREYLLKKLQ